MTKNYLKIDEDIKKYCEIGLDTVGISIPQGWFKITNFEVFRPVSPGRFVSTVTQEQKRKEQYVPKVTLTRQGTGFDMHIELSLPKMLFGNNIYPVLPTQMTVCVERLQRGLAERGIITNQQNIREALVWRVDMCKDMLCGSAPLLIGEIKRRLCIGRATQRDINYKNGGSALRIQTASTDLVIYDKMRESLVSGRSEKLCAEQECYCQKNIIQGLAAEGVEMVRLEKRFPKRRAVKRVFKRFGVRDPRFEDLFNPDVAYTIISEEWGRIMKWMSPAVNHNETLKYAFSRALQPHISLKDVMAYVGWKGLLSECSMCEIKQMLVGKKQKRALGNFIKRLEGLSIRKYNDISEEFPNLTLRIQECESVMDGLPLVDYVAMYENKPNLKDYNIYMQEETPNEEKSGHTC